MKTPPARFLAVAIALGLLAGCKTLSLADIGIKGAGAPITRIETDPPGATVRVEGYGECISPCTIGLDGPRQIIIAKAGYKAQHLELTPGQSRVKFKLELAAPTTNVESTDLPPVN
ncbi:MAG TPA: PEGA domain-containing protein [Parvularculaceae bacterium]|nr:PEGA domain-containing protein [Parvularculaceae bacterium]